MYVLLITSALRQRMWETGVNLNTGIYPVQSLECSSLKNQKQTVTIRLRSQKNLHVFILKSPCILCKLLEPGGRNVLGDILLTGWHRQHGFRRSTP